MLEVESTGSYDRWLNSLRDRSARLRIARQAYRIQAAGRMVGDWKHVGDGVIESRFDFGPGYRVYQSIQGNRLLLLLVGGDKSTQRRDIAKAKEILNEWRTRNGGEL